MTEFITNEDYTEASHKLPRHVKHTATAWPNYPTQFFPFHHGVNVYGQRKRFCRFPFLRHLMTPSEKKNPKLIAQAVLDRYIFFLPFTPPRSTALNFSTHFFLRHLVTQSRSPRHTAQSVLDRFFIFHATSWHRAEVLDTLLKRSTPPCGQTNKTKHPCQPPPDLDRGLRSHTPPKGQERRCKQRKFSSVLNQIKTKTAPNI